MHRKSLIIISQVFVPDPASLGQHVADVAREMARRGHRVLVCTSARGYDDPSVRYPTREVEGNLEIRRLPLSSFGKKSLLTRILATATFMLQCLMVGLFTRRVSGVLFSTSPPLIGAVASIIRLVRRVPIMYWAMDLNPEQLIALGKLRRESLVARVLQKVDRLILRESSKVVVLDRFMVERLRERVAPGKLVVIPPWAHQDRIMPVPRPEENPFRLKHGLNGKFVVMYSGNHSISNPLDTLLSAILRFRDDPSIVFAFVGGGTCKASIEAFAREHRLTNMLSLPYQPLEMLRYSLGAADLHVVTLGDSMVGIVHPCKIYGAMAAARPLLYFGPSPSHVADLLAERELGWHVPHGDADAAERAIRAARTLGPDGLRRIGDNATLAMQGPLNQERLRGVLCDHLELMLNDGETKPAAGHS